MNQFDQFDKLSNIFKSILIWIARRAEEVTIALYNDTIEDIGYAVQLTQNCFGSLIENDESFTLEDVEIIFDINYKKAKMHGSNFALDVLFAFKHDILNYIFDISTPDLSNFISKDISEDYKKKFTYTYNLHNYVPEAKFTYKNTNWPVFWDEGGGAYYVFFIDSKGKRQEFGLVWDWNYPIDRYLELDEGEKINL